MPSAPSTAARAIAAASPLLLTVLFTAPVRAAPPEAVPDAMLGHWMAVEACPGGDSAVLLRIERQGRNGERSLAIIQWNFLNLSDDSPRWGETVTDASMDGARLYLVPQLGSSADGWTFAVSPDGARLAGPTTAGCKDAVFERLSLGGPQVPPKVVRPENLAAAAAPPPALRPVARTEAACMPYQDVGYSHMTPEMDSAPTSTDPSVVAWETLLGVPRSGWTEGLFRAHAERAKGCIGVFGGEDEYLRRFIDHAVDYYRQRVTFEERIPALVDMAERVAAAPLTLATAMATDWFSLPPGVESSYGPIPFRDVEIRWFDQEVRARRAALTEAVGAEVGATAQGIVDAASLEKPRVGEMARTCAAPQLKAFACTAALDRYRMRMSDLRCRKAVADAALPADLARSTVSIGERPHQLETLICDAGRRRVRIGYAASGAMLWKSEKLTVSEGGTPTGELSFTRQKGFNGNPVLEITEVLGTRYTGKGHTVGERYLSCVAWDRC